MPSVDWRAKDFPENDSQIASVIAKADEGQTIFLGFRAPYAKKEELKEGFVRLAAQRWQQIVDGVVAKVKGGR